ncbi:hypothetical protein AB0B85_09965 [Micromonospora sp. NPDC049044]|uniref:hypothetical protein n=1 Tax=unclassified Micromonospora TaxID=2617518 RepID=UPI0033F43C12
MSLFHSTPPASTTTPEGRHEDRSVAPERRGRGTLRVITYGILTGAATAAGKAIVDAVIWLIQH